MKPHELKFGTLADKAIENKWTVTMENANTINIRAEVETDSHYNSQNYTYKKLPQLGVEVYDEISTRRKYNYDGKFQVGELGDSESHKVMIESDTKSRHTKYYVSYLQAFLQLHALVSTKPSEFKL
jgi:hypothetical protein